MSPLTESTRVVLKQPTGASWTITPTNLLPDDADAVAYIAAVEAADGEALEPAVKLAYNSFIKGCKADGIWPSIKASCILAGARTLSGALVPLVGTAPTNYNFVAGDYDRKTGLVGDGSTKYLDSNRNNTADPRNSNHNSLFVSSRGTADRVFLSSGAITSGSNELILGSTFEARSRNRSSTVGIGPSFVNGFFGVSRNDSGFYLQRTSSATTSFSVSSDAAMAGSVQIYARAASFNSDARLAFYSIGESLDLALLDTRVTALVNALAAAIP